MSCFLIAAVAAVLLNHLMMSKARREFRRDLNNEGIEYPFLETSEITVWDKWWSKGVGGLPFGQAGNKRTSLLVAFASVATFAAVFLICEGFQ